MRDMFKRTFAVEERVVFVDCLVLFCDRAGTTPTANRKFFDADELHLSKEGYRIWKQVVERELGKIDHDL